METYQKLCTEFYDLDKPHVPGDALEFYMHYAAKAEGLILEPMCGSGRFLIPMLEQGYAVEGLDSSLHMLKACMKKCAEKKLEPILYSQFVSDMSLDKQYSLIFIPSGSFGLITDVKVAQQCLKIFYDHLLPNGKLVIEIETLHAVPKHLGIWHGKLVDKPDGSKILLNSLPLYDPTSQILRTLQRYELIDGNAVIQSEIEDFKLRLFQHEELDNWLEDAGFKDKDITHFKAYGLGQPGDQDEVVIYECIK
jgi:SAM-dependent methyltransferase